MTLAHSHSSPRRYAILGTGAIGGFYGAHLQRAGLDVHFLVHRDYEHVCQYGLHIESPEGDIHLPQVQAYADSATMPICDVVIVALKTTHNHLLPRLLPPVLHPNSVVLLLQNGLGMEAAIADLVGEERLLSGLCVICANKTAPGFIQHVDYKAITVGAYAADYAAQGVTPPMQQIAQDCEPTGIPIHLAEDLLWARWRKLLWNIPFNGLSVTLNARTDEIMNHPDSRALAEVLMREVAAIAQAYHRILPEQAIVDMLAHTAAMQPYITSMKLDFDHHRPLELDAIFGNPLQAAQQAQVRTPHIHMLYQQLRFLDARNTSILST